MQAKIALQLSRIIDQPQPHTSLQERDQKLTEIIEEELAHKTQVSMLSHMHLQQA